MFYVYAYYLPDCSDPIYIGKGQGDRAYKHLEQASLELPDLFHRKLKAALAKRIQPTIEFLWENLTEEEALEYEIAAIQHYGRVNTRTGCLLNLTEGGEGSSGYKHNQETKTRMSLLATERCSNPLYRKEFSERIKGNTFKKGKTGCPGANPRRVAKLRLGRIDREYESVSDASRKTDISSRSLWDALNGRSKTCRGYQWIYLD